MVQQTWTLRGCKKMQAFRNSLSDARSTPPPLLHQSLPRVQALPKVKDGRLSEIVDPRLQEYPEAEMQAFIAVAASCSKPTRITRPSIDDVAAKLQEIGGGAATLVATTPSGLDRPLEGSSSGES